MWKRPFSQACFAEWGFAHYDVFGFAFLTEFTERHQAIVQGWQAPEWANAFSGRFHFSSTRVSLPRMHPDRDIGDMRFAR